MKVFKLVIGIILFWAIVLLGGGIVGLLMKLLNAIVPGYFSSNWFIQVFCNLIAAVIASILLQNLSDKNELVVLINSLLALVATAILTVFSLISRTFTIPQLIGYILTVVYFGYVCISAFVAKGKEKDEMQKM